MKKLIKNLKQKIGDKDETILGLEKRDIERSRIENKKDEDINYFRNLASQYEKQMNNITENSYILTTERNKMYDQNNTSFENFRRNKELRMSTHSDIDLARKYSDTYFYKNEN